MKKIILQPDEVWDYYMENLDELRGTQHIIASDDSFGVEILLSVNNADRPIFSVETDDEILEETVALTKPDCESTVKDLYEYYIDNGFKTLAEIRDEIEEEDEDTKNKKLYINRESELTELFEDLIWGILDSKDAKEFSDDKIEVLKDHTCEYIARVFGVDIYRPSYLEASDGTEMFERYPYDKMIFDNEFSPVFAKYTEPKKSK